MAKKYWCPDCDRRLRRIHFRLTPFYCCWRCKKIWIDTELEERRTDLDYRMTSWLFGVKHKKEEKEKEWDNDGRVHID